MAGCPALRAGQPVHRQRNPVNLTRATIALAFYRLSIAGLSVLRLLSNPREQAPVNEPDAPYTMPG